MQNTNKTSLSVKAKTNTAGLDPQYTEKNVREATTVPRPPLESSRRGESTESGSPRRILLFQGLRSFSGASVRMGIKSGQTLPRHSHCAGVGIGWAYRLWTVLASARQIGWAESLQNRDYWTVDARRRWHKLLPTGRACRFSSHAQPYNCLAAT